MEVRVFFSVVGENDGWEVLERVIGGGSERHRHGDTGLWRLFDTLYAKNEGQGGNARSPEME